MNQTLPRNSCSLLRRNAWRRLSHSFLPGTLALATLLFAGTGCHRENAVQVQLFSRESNDKDLLGLEIDAQISGPQDGLRYKWFSYSGECSPQESDLPSTKFKFADTVNRDHISLEVWRGKRCVARGGMDVTLNEERLRAETEHAPAATIAITNIPPYDFKGGSATHADIGGMVTGKHGIGYQVIIYTRVSDSWYIQPMADSAEPVSEDGTWTNWAHTGWNYAALLVRPGYYSLGRLDVLPPVGGYVVAKCVVDGVKN
jgi:hypothetical protein